MALAQIVLILGGETVLADRALSQVLEQRADFEKTVLDGAQLDSGKFAETVAPSLFADQRVVVVRELQDVVSEVQEEIEQQFAHLEPNLHLVFLHKGGVKGKALLEKIKKLKPDLITCEPIKKVADKEEERFQQPVLLHLLKQREVILES
jgi:DNA polymerase-3 subunit delta